VVRGGTVREGTCGKGDRCQFNVTTEERHELFIPETGKQYGEREFLVS